MTRFYWPILLTGMAAYLILALINPLFDSVNLKVRTWINRTRRPVLRPLMVLTHHFNDVPALSAQLVAVSLFVGLYFRDWYRATVLTATIFLQTLIVGISKRLTSIDRPPQIAAHVFMTSGSFPSGHSSISLSFALLVPAVLRPYLPEPLLLFIGIYLVSAALLTAYGRLYLDVHWLTDVCGGWILAGATYMLSRMLI